jgi:hypothetical protein
MFTVTKTVTKYKLVNFVIEKNRKLLKRYILDKWHISILDVYKKKSCFEYTKKKIFFLIGQTNIIFGFTESFLFLMLNSLFYIRLSQKHVVHTKLNILVLNVQNRIFFYIHLYILEIL